MQSSAQVLAPPAATDHEAPRTTGSLYCGLSLLVALSLSPASAQVEEIDLDADTPAVAEQLLADFEQAEALYASVDQPEAVAIYSRLIAELLPQAAIGSQDQLRVLTQSLAHRAVVQFNLGSRREAEAGLQELLRLDPDYQLDTTAPRQLAAVYQQLRDRSVGTVVLSLLPSDAAITVSGRALRGGAPQSLLAGAYNAFAERPGYAPTTIPFTVEGGKTTAVSIALSRISAAVTLRTLPADAQVLIDGVPRARTVGTAEPGFEVPPDLARHAAADFSELLLIPDIGPGGHDVVVSKPGFRPWRGRVNVDRLVDYRFAPVVLEREAGTLLLTNLPADAQVTLDGRSQRPTRATGQEPLLLLSPGNYVLAVTRGGGDYFESAVAVRDKETTTVEVRLRPALIWLGALGGDQPAAARLTQELADQLTLADDWALLDRSGQATELFNELGVDALALRRLATPTADAATQPFDWSRIQRAASQAFPGSLYLLGVLGDDLIATDAHLWALAAAPGPPMAANRRVDLRAGASADGVATVTRFVEGLAPALENPRAVLGAVLFDSLGAEGPTIAYLRPDGPAARAGLRTGDRLTAIGGRPVFTTAQVDERLTELGADAIVAVEALSGTTRSSTELRIGRSDLVVDATGGKHLLPAFAVEIQRLLQRQSSWPRWVLELNQAQVLLAGGDAEGAVRVLRAIDRSVVPSIERPGLGEGALEYLLARALEQAGPQYLEYSAASYRRAATSVEGRLAHDDGPFVAPRARARLAHLGLLP
jgi:hypothetical protein